MSEAIPAGSRAANTVFVAFDVETTGLWPPAAKLVELAAVRFRLGSAEVDTFSELIDPGVPIPRGVVGIHGITDEMVRGHPGPGEIVARWIDFAGRDSVLVAHNAGFDARFIAVEIAKARLPVMPNPLVDSRALSKSVLSGLSSHSLVSVARALGIAETQEHRALGDAMLVRGILEKMAADNPALATGDSLLQLGKAKHISDWGVSLAEAPPGWDDLREAMRKGTRLVIEYDTGSRTTRAVTPLVLTRARGNFYLTAFCHLRNAERLFRLDRVVSHRLEDE